MVAHASITGDMWRTLPASMQDLRIRPLLVLRLQVAPPLQIGITPTGAKRFAVVEGGTFEGNVPGFTGKVHSGGNDLVTEQADGVVVLDARIVLETDGGESIVMTYRGIRHGDPAVLLRLAQGGTVDPADYVFRIVPSFATAAPCFDWLNNAVCVGIGAFSKAGPTYSVFEIL